VSDPDVLSSHGLFELADVDLLQQKVNRSHHLAGKLQNPDKMEAR
jgi:hypothetical protein